MRAGVAVLADIHFGHRVPVTANTSRFSYATQNDNIVRGVERIAEWVKRSRK